MSTTQFTSKPSPLYFIYVKAMRELYGALALFVAEFVFYRCFHHNLVRVFTKLFNASDSYMYSLFSHQIDNTKRKNKPDKQSTMA